MSGLANPIHPELVPANDTQTSDRLLPECLVGDALVARGASPQYYKPTLLGYRLLHGEDAQPPTKRHFAEIGVARHHHTHCLAEFLVRTIRAAHRRQLNFLVEIDNGTERISSTILDLARRLAPTPQLSLFYGTHLPRYLARRDPLHSASFLDHRGRPVALVPRRIPTS